MNTKQMEYILELARTKNFNRAAENLYISQPALTYQIKTAEEEIGFNIFERSGKGVYVTPAGEQFIVAIANILDELNHAIERGVNNNNRYTRTITLGIPFRSCLSRLPEAIHEQKKRFPSVPITAKFAYAHYKIQHPSDFDTDISFALHESFTKLSGFREYPLYESHLYAITSAHDPLAKAKVIGKAELANRTVAVHSGKYPPIMRRIRALISSIHTGNIELAHDFETCILLAETDTAIPILPGFLLEPNPKFAIIPFDTEKTIPCSLITSSNEHRDSVISVVKLLQDIYKKKHQNDIL